MYQRPAILDVPDRPAKYVRVPCDVEEAGGELVFRLPNEQIQFAILAHVARKMGGGPVTLSSMLRNLDTLAAVVGLCWYHPVIGLSCADAVVDVAVSILDSGDDGADRFLGALGREAIDELDAFGLGSHRTLAPAFTAIMGAMSRSFVGQEVVDERLGFSGAPPASGG